MASKQVICDTDVIIDYWDRSNTRYLKTKQAIDDKIGLDNVVICSITKMELMLGALNRTDLSRITKSLLRFNTILINEDINLEAINQLDKYSLSHGLSLPDSLIAAAAIIADLDLFTYNTKDYKFIDGLKLFKP